MLTVRERQRSCDKIITTRRLSANMSECCTALHTASHIVRALMMCYIWNEIIIIIIRLIECWVNVHRRRRRVYAIRRETCVRVQLVFGTVYPFQFRARPYCERSRPSCVRYHVFKDFHFLIVLQFSVIGPFAATHTHATHFRLILIFQK